VARVLGRAIVDHLLSVGRQVMVVHRRDTEPPDLAVSPHLHVDRRRLLGRRDEIEEFEPDAMVHCLAITRDDAVAALAAAPATLRLLVLSSDAFLCQPKGERPITRFRR
jgi:nucleoside-diphosphate-sugar epimerase